MTAAVTDKTTYSGQEYLGLYPFITYNMSGGRIYVWGPNERR